MPTSTETSRARIMNSYWNGATRVSNIGFVMATVVGA